MGYLRLFWPVLSGLGMLSVSMAIACEAPSSQMTSGIQGTVMLGPVCPVVRAGVDCASRPYKATFAVVNAQGKVVERVESGETGTFTVKLPPGTYTLRSAEERSAPPFLKEQPSITVMPDQMTEVTLHFDSGLR